MADEKRRHTARYHCPICDGYREQASGKGIRCAGFTSGLYVYCTREQLAGNAPFDDSTQPPTFRHWIGDGDCKCGTNHSGRSAAPRSAPAAQRPRADSRPGNSTSGRSAAPEGPQEGDPAWYVKNCPPKEEYVYCDPDTGEALAVHGRWEWPDPSRAKGYDKTFRWRLPEGKWTGLEGMSEKLLPPWGAEELVLLPLSVPVVVVEGEEAAKAVRTAGMFAVCWGGGAGQVEFLDKWLALFKRRTVYLWPDNDPAGAFHMYALRTALSPVVQSVAYIGPTGGPKDDAADYFKADSEHTMEHRLANTIHEDDVAQRVGVLFHGEVQTLAPDHIRVRLPLGKKDIATFDFEGLNAGRRGLASNLTVSKTGKEERWEGELELSSISTRDKVRLQLENLYDERGKWTAPLNQAYSLVKDRWKQIPISKPLSEMRKDPDMPWLVDWLVLERTSVVFFGQGSSLKGYFTQGLAFAMATGATEYCGHRIRREAPVIIVDYEDPETTWLRMSRICRGEGLDPQILDDLPIEIVDPQGIVFADLVDRLALTAQMVTERYGATPLLIIDSATYACPEPSREWAVGPFFRAIRRLNLPTVIIAHVGWGQLENGGEASIRRAYGHIMWETAPRRTFSFRRTSDEDTDEITIRVRNEKSNAKKSSEFAVRVTFEGTNGPVEIKPAKIAQALFPDEMSPKSQAMKVLRSTTKSLTTTQIWERCPGNPSQGAVRKALNRGREEGWCTVDDERKGRDTYWRYVPQTRMPEQMT